jgi:hypothetical protein
LGYSAGLNTVSGSNIGNSKVFLGTYSGQNNSGDLNIYVGMQSGMNSSGDMNLALGSGSGTGGSGSDNIFLGRQTGALYTGSSNIFIGNQAGMYKTGDNNLCIESSYSHQYYPLIEGNFTTRTLQINGTFSFNPPGNTITLPVVRGTAGQFLSTDGNGGTEWLSL